MYPINVEVVHCILKEMPVHKKEQLAKALDRNLFLTSSRVLEHGNLNVYKEGWFLKLFGTRSVFSIFVYDNDGEFVFANRKPSEDKLHRLYSDWLHLSEEDFDLI